VRISAHSAFKGTQAQKPDYMHDNPRKGNGCR